VRACGHPTGPDLTDTALDQHTGLALLEKMLQFIRDLDTLVLHSRDQLARNLDNRRNLVKWMRTKVAPLELLKEQLVNKQNRGQNSK
jgi:DNA invertase Pin-like site-specific DNA recombinase